MYMQTYCFDYVIRLAFNSHTVVIFYTYTIYYVHSLPNFSCLPWPPVFSQKCLYFHKNTLVRRIISIIFRCSLAISVLIKRIYKLL